MYKGLLKRHSGLLNISVRFIDVIIIMLGGYLSYILKFQNFILPNYYFTTILLGSLLTFFVFPLFKIYESHRIDNYNVIIRQLFFSLIVVVLLLLILSATLKVTSWYSRIWFGSWFVFNFSLLLMLRMVVYLTLRFMRLRGWNQRRIVIIGATELGEIAAKRIQSMFWLGFNIVAFLDDEVKAADINSNISVHGIPKDIEKYVEDHDIDEVWFALPLKAIDKEKNILHQLRHSTVQIRQVLDVFDLDVINHSLTELAGLPVLNIKTSPMLGMNHILKAIEDRLLAVFILMAISPVMLLIALGVKLTSKGPVFFKQKRVSWNGKAFDILKFRSMPVDAEAKSGAVWAKAGDNRATKFGAFLRRTSLDELPQFINVLKGDMSIVGPRPERPELIENFKHEVPRYMQKHLVKAGITGWAQIHGWRGNTDLNKRIEHDLYYIEHWSLWLDFKIIFLTLFCGFANKNAY